MAPVTADGYFPGFRVFGRYSPAELPCESLREFAVGNAPNVVSPEDVLRDLSFFASMSKPAGTPCTLREFFDDLKFDLLHGYDDQLRDTFANFDGKSVAPAVPARDHDFSLVVGVDQPDQVAEHDAVLVAQSGTRQDQRGVARIRDVDQRIRPEPIQTGRVRASGVPAGRREGLARPSLRSRGSEARWNRRAVYRECVVRRAAWEKSTTEEAGDSRAAM